MNTFAGGLQRNVREPCRDHEGPTGEVCVMCAVVFDVSCGV